MSYGQRKAPFRGLILNLFLYAASSLSLIVPISLPARTTATMFLSSSMISYIPVLFCIAFAIAESKCLYRRGVRCNAPRIPNTPSASSLLNDSLPLAMMRNIHSPLFGLQRLEILLQNLNELLSSLDNFGKQIILGCLGNYERGHRSLDSLLRLLLPFTALVNAAWHELLLQ